MTATTNDVQLPGYRVDADRFDEAVDASGSVREPWIGLARLLGQLGPAELERRRRDAGRVVEAQGAGHIFHDDGSDASRPWRLDPLPFVVSSNDWAALEIGITQRVRLLELILQDLYGPADLARSGRVPAAALFGTPDLCEPALGMVPNGGRWLTVYGADLVRTADGTWRVLRDHTDAPVGAGYARLNRDVLGVLAPDFGTAARPLSLSSYFGAYRDAVGALAPTGSDSPRTVVLSSGLGHASFFEHSYLATTLGYHLAEVGDISVNGGRAWLRSIGGLEPVDVLIRRLDGRHSDPLEQSGAASGVAGLLHAARRGGVGLANAIGSGLACSLTLHHVLPSLAEHLLGEPLRLGALDAFWCGDAEVCRTVRADPAPLVLHDVGGPNGVGLPSTFGADLDDDGWADWQALLTSAPHRVVAQPRVRFATSPVLTGEGLVAGTVVLRVQAVAGPDGVSVLPGGLARVVNPSRPVVHQTEGFAKDAWVLDDGTRRKAVTSTQRSARMPQIDLSGSLPVRAAESMTWVSRHAERAEALARATRSALTMVQDDPALLTAAEGAWRRFVTRGLLRLSQRSDLQGAILWRDAVTQAEDTLAQRIEKLARAASAVRSYQSNSTWVVLGELGDLADQLRAESRSLAARVDLLDSVVIRLAALSGFAVESTVRGPAWRYLDLGRRLERAMVVLDSLDPELGPALPVLVRADAFDHVLRSNESLIAYRRRFRSDAELGALLDLLVRDHTNPRSLTFQLDTLREHLVALGSRDRHEELPRLVDECARAVLAADPLTVEPDLLVATLVRGVRRALITLSSRLVAVHFADPVLVRPMGRNQ